jgi:hypothetical protein
MKWQRKREKILFEASVMGWHTLRKTRKTIDGSNPPLYLAAQINSFSRALPRVVTH